MIKACNDRDAVAKWLSYKDVGCCVSSSCQVGKDDFTTMEEFAIIYMLHNYSSLNYDSTNVEHQGVA